MLTKKEFNKIMDSFDIKVPRLHMNWNELRELKEAGNIIGLHSYSHPRISDLDKKDQYKEYKENYWDLFNNVDVWPDLKLETMAHPFGSYNKKALVILRNFEIKIGFNNNPDPSDNLLTFPRTDISNL